MDKKKEKIVWVDDGRTIADMSGVGGSMLPKPGGRSTGSFKDKWNTYWAATKMMLLPTLVFAGALAAVYLVMLLLFKAM